VAGQILKAEIEAARIRVTKKLNEARRLFNVVLRKVVTPEQSQKTFYYFRKS
jgi:ribosomal protein L16/L10AE